MRFKLQLIITLIYVFTLIKVTIKRRAKLEIKKKKLSKKVLFSFIHFMHISCNLNSYSSFEINLLFLSLWLLIINFYINLQDEKRGKCTSDLLRLSRRQIILKNDKDQQTHSSVRSIKGLRKRIIFDGLRFCFLLLTVHFQCLSRLSQSIFSSHQKSYEKFFWLMP